jgi:hypothetical protein
MQREHVVMLAGGYLVTDLDDHFWRWSSRRLPAWFAVAAAFFRMAYAVIISRGMIQIVYRIERETV